MLQFIFSVNIYEYKVRDQNQPFLYRLEHYNTMTHFIFAYLVRQSRQAASSFLPTHHRGSGGMPLLPLAISLYVLCVLLLVRQKNIYSKFKVKHGEYNV